MGWSGENFTRTNGVNTGSQVWQDDRDAGTKIRADRHDTHDQDLADGINATLKKDGGNTPTADLPMNSQKHTGVGNADARDQYAAVGQVQDSGFNFVPAASVAGTADAITLAPSPAITAYAAGQCFSFLPESDNTGAATVDVSSLGTKSITKHGAQALTAGNLTAGEIAHIIYDGTQFQLLNPKVVTTRGDVIIGDANGDEKRLAIGSDGQALVSDGADVAWGDGGGITLGTPQATTSGTVIDFTGLPAGITRISITPLGVSTNGTSDYLVQLGDSGGFETAGYTSTVSDVGGTTASSSAGFVVANPTVSGDTLRGTITLTRHNTSHGWVSTSMLRQAGDIMTGAGSKTLSAELTQIRITTVGGDTFDAGAINIAYE